MALTMAKGLPESNRGGESSFWRIAGPIAARDNPQRVVWERPLHFSAISMSLNGYRPPPMASRRSKHGFHGTEKRDHYAFRPKLPITPLTVLSVTAVMTRGNMLSPPSPVALVDTHICAEPSRFLQENFGC
jgi:hypothetical protein